MARDHSELPDIDAYTAGFPRQGFSYLGKRKGFEDKRSHVLLLRCTWFVMMCRQSSDSAASSVYHAVYSPITLAGMVFWTLSGRRGHAWPCSRTSEGCSCIC